MVAVSVTVGVGIMVGSFRETVVVWLDSSLEADIYVSPPGFAVNRIDATLDPRAVIAIRSDTRDRCDQRLSWRDDRQSVRAGPIDRT